MATKAELKRELVSQLEAQLATAREAHAAATEAATSDEARPENDKDTRGLEQSYLARGQAQRVADLETAVAIVSAMQVGAQGKVGVGALVTVEEDDRTRQLFVAPHGGGLVLAETITVVTPTSPMGKALLGKAEDDECEVTVGGTRRTLVVTAVA